MKTLDLELFRSLLFSDLAISAEGLSVHRFGVNQHLPTTRQLEPHEHRRDQLLLYLKGEGTQFFPEHDETYTAQRGDFFVIPAGLAHGFSKQREYPPIVLSVTFSGGNLAFAGVHRLAPNGIKSVENCLLRLAQQPAPSSYHAAAQILQVVATLIAAAQPVQLLANPNKGSYEWKVQQALAQLPAEQWSSRAIAAQLSLSTSLLSRKLVQEGGCSVSQLINRERLQRAKQALGGPNEMPIGEVAVEAGLTDQNYFSRWFKKRTGYAPSEWREKGKGREYTLTEGHLSANLTKRED